LGIDVYAIGVDRYGLLVGGGEDIRRIQAIRNRRKKFLRFSTILQEWDSHIDALAVSVSRPASAGFLF
jgi:hypothetical protein